MATVTPHSGSCNVARGARPRKITGNVANPSERPGGSVGQLGDTERESYALRARGRRLSQNLRTQGCGIRCVQGDGVELEVRTRTDGAHARWVGVQRCEHRWTCPVCARRIITRRRQQIADAVERGATHARRAVGADNVQRVRTWRMVTLTLRHHSGQRLADLLRGLRAAWRATRQRGTVQRAFRAHVLASARAVEVTLGPNGWHPHIHVLILSDQWDDSEVQALASTWTEMVTRELGAACAPDDAHAVRWSHTLRETYLAKLGLELTGAAKAGSPMGLLNDASDAYALARALRDPEASEQARSTADRARDLWQEFERATKGVRAIELDPRAVDLAERGAQDRLALEDVRASSELAHVSVWSIEVSLDAMLALRAVERYEPGALLAVLRVVERARGPDDGLAMLDAFIREGLARAPRPA